MQEQQTDTDDFQYIEDGVINLAQNIDFMKETINYQKEMLEEVLVSRLLSGTISGEEISSYLEKIGKPYFPCYSMMALSFVAEAQWNQEPDKNILMATIREFIKKEVYQKIFLVPMVWERMIVFLIGDDSSYEMDGKISEIKVQLDRLLEQKEIVSLQFGVSRQFSSLKDTFRALHECVEAAKIISDTAGESSNQTKYSTIMMYAEFVENTENTYAYPIDRESEIKELVDLCKTKEACDAVNIFIDNLYEKKIPAEERRYYLQRLLLSILTVASDAGIGIVEIENLDNQDLFVGFWQLYDVQKIKEYVCGHVISPIIEQLIIFRSKNVQSIEDKVYALIKKSRGDITLVECAEKLNYHPNYIGRVLRCENNTSFTAYVAAKKLEYAKELLLETELSIADIAKKLNYTNTQNFIRFFNKQEHVTPGQYRKSFGIKNKGELE
ncbi:MAG: helix-turn-helix transcriptional regulator [bacterium]|nr:helix-turn-helix transcriptional regulator [bacterium]